MDFTCTKCGKEFQRLRGWKAHMTREHNGYDEEDIAAAIAASEGSVSEENVAARMEAFSRSIGTQQEGGAGDDVDANTREGVTSTTGTEPASQPKVKTIKATPKRLQKILGGIPTKILESQIELDDDDRKALDEAGEFLSDIFGVEFEVPQDKRVLHSRFWALVWVAGVALLIYVKHRFSDIWVKVMESYKADKEKPAEETVGSV